MKLWLTVGVLLFCTNSVAKQEAFRFHLIGEPYTLDPARTRGSSGSYLFFNIYRGLFKYRSDTGLVLEQAKSCRREKLKLNCQLKPDLKFNDGSAIKAKHYVLAFRRLIAPQTKTVQTELLLNLKNAKKILSGKAKAKSLGVRALNPLEIEFSFDQEDFEFEYKLAATPMVPLKNKRIPERKNAKTLISNGPYQIDHWQPGQKIRLSPNPHSQHFKKSLPPVEVLFIEDDNTALRLYELKRLSLLRRLPTQYFYKYKKRTDFYQIPMARFDYIGFGSKLKASLPLRKALAHSLNYPAFQKMLDALGQPGCASLPRRFTDKIVCHNFNVSTAQKSLKKLAKKIKTQRFTLSFSRLGGEDIFRSMQWVQNQWAKHLGLKIELAQVEQAMYLHQLGQGLPTIFRKGISLDRPTCLAALEVFDKDSRENYIKINDKVFQNILASLASASRPKDKRHWCQKGVEFLVQNYYFIPLGEIHFSILAHPQFEGWHLSELNQLDLSNLKLRQ